MSITDELREWAHGFNGPWRRNEEMLLAIADRIDEQHRRALDSAWSATVHEVLEQATDELSDEWVKLPVDADGVPIHVGDYVETQIEAFKGERGRVECLTEDGWCVDGDRPSTVRHVQPDSWERIIQDAVKLGYADYPTTFYEAELVERCRRLAGEAK